MPLEQIPLSDAADQFMKDREQEMREATVTNQRYHIRSFIDWSNEQEIEYTTDLNGFLVNQYKTWRRDTSDINSRTLYNNLMTIRVFLRWGQRRELFEQGLFEKLEIPGPGDDARDDKIPPERAEDIINASIRTRGSGQYTVLWYLLWHTGIRIGGAQALDVDDWEPKPQRLYLKHRPDTGTPLKNGADGERPVSITNDDLAELMKNYIKYNRRPVTDKYDREPLFTSRQGRPTAATLRSRVQHLSQPCHYGECPHDRDPDECAAVVKVWKSYECPSAVNPHTVRRSNITHYLKQGVNPDVVSDRVNASRETIDKHYDVRTPEEQAELREEHLKDFNL